MKTKPIWTHLEFKYQGEEPRTFEINDRVEIEIFQKRQKIRGKILISITPYRILFESYQMDISLNANQMEQPSHFETIHYLPNGELERINYPYILN